jgi:hypothetical protein
MNRKVLGGILLLVGSLAGGTLTGNLFFNLFTKTVPPAVLTSFNKGTAHGAFIFYGVVLGVAIFLWALVAILASPLFREGKKNAGSRA